MSAFAHEDPDHDYSYAEADPAETSTPPIPQDQSMGTDTDASHTRGHSNNPLLGSDNPLVSDLEQEVLEEYARLLRNVNQVRGDDPSLFFPLETKLSLREKYPTELVLQMICSMDSGPTAY
jgi:hypothetical protein